MGSPVTGFSVGAGLPAKRGGSLSGAENRGEVGLNDAAAFHALPDFLMEVEGDGIERRFDQRHRSAEQNAAGDGVDYTEGDGEMHYCEGKGFGHGALQMGIIAVSAILSAPRTIQNITLSIELI